MKRQTISRFLADASVIIGLTTTVVWAFVWAEPARRGFYCNDTSIEYPYRSDTVTFRMVLVIVFPIPLILLLLVEILNVVNAAKFVDSKKSDDVNGGTEENTAFHISEESKMTSPVTDRKRNAVKGRAVLRLGVIALRNTCRIGLLFWFGLLITLCITEVGKLGVGRLRPHFLDVCRPTGFNCSQGYVTDYQCLGKPRNVLQARKSFPSGHASASAYVALFVVIHMQRRLPVYRAMGLLLRPLLQVALLTGAFYTGLSRVHDYKHHPSDVIVGDVIGILCAAWLMHSVHKHVTYRKCTPTDVACISVNNDVV